ncbi:MAG: HAD family hydrolase [Candidatus Eisenbacteria bacterium]|nr:HAD family hydrolase [Candidatus Eisenbacteria bacterium]
MDPLLLILDLDNTLICTCEKPLSRPADFTFGEYHMYKRPGLEAFLEACRGQFRVAVWTSATSSYAGCVISHLFPPGYDLEFLWTRERCTPRYNAETRELEYLKDLKKVRRSGYRLERVLIVDDSPGVLQRSYSNVISIRPFTGSADDAELEYLLPYLDRLSHLENVRVAEKRSWRGLMRGPGST